MPATTRQTAASGLVGALTSVFVSMGTQVFPDGNMKALISILAGITASILTYEILAWLAVFRLERQRRAINNIIPKLEEVQERVHRGISHQLETMKVNNASAAQLKEVQSMLAASSHEAALALLDMQKKAVQIVREIN